MASTATQRKQYEKYKPLVLQLEDMGFTDRKHSLAVLVDCKGDMDKAVVALTRNPGKRGGTKTTKTVKGFSGGAPDLLLCADDPMGLDSVGDLLSNDAPSGGFDPMNLSSAMQPSTNASPGLMQPNVPQNIQAAMRQSSGQAAGNTGSGAQQSYQSAFMVGGARQQQQQRAPSGPTIGGMCQVPSQQQQQQQQQQQIPPQLLRQTQAPQSNSSPGLLQPTSSPAGLLKPNSAMSPMMSANGSMGHPMMQPTSKPTMSLPTHSAPKSGGVTLPAGSLSGLCQNNKVAAAAPAPSPVEKKGFGGLLSQMKDSM